MRISRPLPIKGDKETIETICEIKRKNAPAISCPSNPEQPSKCLHDPDGMPPSGSFHVCGPECLAEHRFAITNASNGMGGVKPWRYHITCRVLGCACAFWND